MNEPGTDQYEILRERLMQEEASLRFRLEQNGHFQMNEAQTVTTGELSVYDNHPADTATELYERGKDLALNEHAEIQLDEIVDALHRMDRGAYGVCLNCEQPIDAERLDALPTARFCKEHAVDRHVSDRRPVEEQFLQPPFGRSELDERADRNLFDGEDAWQIVERWGNSDSPAMAEDPEIFNYNDMEIEADEAEGFVDPIESFLSADLHGQGTDYVQNKHYRRYMSAGEGDRTLERQE